MRALVSRHIPAVTVCILLPIWIAAMLGSLSPAKTDAAAASASPALIVQAADTARPFVFPEPYSTYHQTPLPTDPPQRAATTGTCKPAVATTAPQLYLLGRIGQREYNCAAQIIAYESKWNPAAVNPKSGACGLPQALPCSQMAPGWTLVLSHKTWGIWITSIATGRGSPTDWQGQLDWTIAYAHHKYGTFANAAALEFGACEGEDAARTCTPGRNWW